MCGIFAVLQTKKIWTESVLEDALDAIRHRGPDSKGSWAESEIFLGHRRLAIIDLNTGSQPMFSHDKRYVIIFNGEIYNYRELRVQLKTEGHKFFTASDTEVIIEAYRHWGVGCLEHIEGIFAFVLWDRKTKNLLAARDRLGVKPLCWSLGPGYLIFSSTLETLYKLPRLPRELNYEGLRDLLVFDYIPTPYTILKNVYKLPPASYLRWSLEHPQPKIEAFWKIPNEIQPLNKLNEIEISEYIEKTIEKAVIRQMISDVPLGAFLSGGIDSSLLVALMARHSKDPIKTFSISFKGKEFDESPYAKEVAQRFSTEHTVFPAEEISGQLMMNIIGGMDEPFADPTLIPTYVLSALTRQSVTVALSGDGGDEIFGGYPKYLLGVNKHQNPWLPFVRPLKWMIEFLPFRPRGAGRFYWHTLNNQEQIQYSWTHYGDFPVFRKDLRQVLTEYAVEKAKVNNYFLSWEIQAKQWGTNYNADLLMRTDLTTYLSENCLVKTDRMSMLNSLEVRVPYLDELVVNEVVPLPVGLKIYNGKLKNLLIPIAQKLLPDCTWNRPKHGFSVPLGHYLGSVWQKDVREMIEWGQLNLPLFDYPYLKRLNRINNQSFSIGRELWTPLVFLIWCSSHYDKISI